MLDEDTRVPIGVASWDTGDCIGNRTPDGWVDLTKEEITAAWLRGTGKFNVDWHGVREVLWELQRKNFEKQKREKQ